MIGRATTYRHQLGGVEDVHGFVKRVCFKTGPPGTVGIESEWFVVDTHRPHRHVDISTIEAAVGRTTLPRGSLVTYEPGGQLELSSAAAPDLSTACRNLAADLHVARRAVARAGLLLVGQGTDPVRPPQVQSRGPRYAAMRQFFNGQGGAGEAMMTSTAAVQVSLDAGRDEADVARRWHLANALLPVLLATFANSPLQRGRPTGKRSTRYGLWSDIDPGRTRVPDGSDPAEAWARYALAARVMLVRTETGPWIADPGITFEQWVSGKTDLPGPTEDDLAYHLTTLFPPVRPRGWFEIRYLDQLPDGLWQAAAAVTTALIEDPCAGDTAAEAAAPVAGLTAVAVHAAVTDPRLHRAAERCLDAATEALPRIGAPDLVPVVDRFRERYTARGRCPADDILENGVHQSTGHENGVPQQTVDLTTTETGRHALWP
jgi:glutamate--cysteine ligase